jgi:hypothetical protein
MDTDLLGVEAAPVPDSAQVNFKKFPGWVGSGVELSS